MSLQHAAAYPERPVRCEELCEYCPVLCGVSDHNVQSYCSDSAISSCLASGNIAAQSLAQGGFPSRASQPRFLIFPLNKFRMAEIINSLRIFCFRLFVESNQAELAIVITASKQNITSSWLPTVRHFPGVCNRVLDLYIRPLSKILLPHE